MHVQGITLNYVGNVFPGLVGTVGIQLDAIAKCFGAAGDCLKSSTVAYAGVEHRGRLIWK
jgi:hypothetical protein